jgi:hypothetical protein
MAHNVPRLCDVALRPTRARRHVAEARGSAAEPEAPRRVADVHTCCYGTLRSLINIIDRKDLVLLLLSSGR